MQPDTGRHRTLLDAAKVGQPLIDRFGNTWWLVRNSNQQDRVHRLVCAPTPEAAQRREHESVRYLDLKEVCGPLRVSQLP